MKTLVVLFQRLRSDSLLTFSACLLVCLSHSLAGITVTSRQFSSRHVCLCVCLRYVIGRRALTQVHPSKSHILSPQFQFQLSQPNNPIESSSQHRNIIISNIISNNTLVLYIQSNIFLSFCSTNISSSSTFALNGRLYKKVGRR